MKMTTEEAFVKVLQMHGIEQRLWYYRLGDDADFGLVPGRRHQVLGLCAHEVNAGMSADGYTRASGKMSMAIAQNGPGITNLRDPDQDRLLEPHADAAGHTAGGQQDHRPGRLPGSQADGPVRGHGLLPGRGARSEPDRRGIEPGDRKGLARLGAGARSISRGTTGPR